MGGGGKGGSTTVNKVEIPPEVLARYNAVNARAETVAQQPYQEYSQDPNAFVAPLTQTQQAGIQNTNAMAGAAQPYYGAATGLAAASTGNVNPQDLNVNQYMNPFTQNVVNATQAALQQQQGQQLSQQQSDAIRGGAFGGERAGLQRAQLMGQQGLATAQAISPLYQQNYNQALAAAQQQQGVNLGAQQANRQNLQNAATLFGSIGTNAQQAGLAGAQAQLQAGQGEQQTQQAGLQALYNQFQQKQGYPFQVAQFLANIAEGTGALSGNTTTQTTTGGGGFFSDKRLKENVQKVGKTNDGQPIYRFNYKGDPRTQIGLMAQDVEKSHPEAVGLAGGYKTVDYKKATDDAVHSRRHFSGEEGSFVAPSADAYSMTGSPSTMLSGLSLPKMTDGANIHIQPGAINPAAAGLLAPKATGYSPGTREGKQAEADSLRSSLASGYGSGIGSGPDYMNKRLVQLDDFLAQNSSQGGLVGPGGGSFARGGLAFGGVPDYTNPALAYYGPQQGQGGGLYGVQLQPGGQHQMMQGAQIQKPQQRDAMAELAATAKFAEGATGAWDKRPDFLRSEEDVAMRDRIKEAADVKNRQTIEDYYKNHPDEADKSDDGNARGGLIGHRHHYSGNAGSYVNPKASPFAGSNDWMGIDEQQPQYHLMKGGEMQRQPQQQSGISQLAKGASEVKSLAKGADWAAGKLGLGAAPEASTGALGAATAPTGGVIDLTTAAAPEAIAGAAPALAGAGEAAAGVGAAAEGAGLLGGIGSGLAAAGSTAAEALPFLLGFLSDERAKHDIEKVGTLFDGQPVYRYAYNGDDKTQMGLLAQKVEKIHPDAVGLASGMKTVDYEKATDKAAKRGHYRGQGFVIPEDYVGDADFTPPPAPAPEERPAAIPAEPPVRGARAAAPASGLGAAPLPKPVQVGDNELTVVPPGGIPDNAGNRLPTKIPKIVERREPAQKPFIPSLEGLGAAAKDTLSSENFWVPALTGIGAMLASPNKTLAGAIGSGLVAGTGAYTGLEKQQNDMIAKRYEMAKNMFSGPYFSEDGKTQYWLMAGNPKRLSREEYAAAYSKWLGMPSSQGASSAIPGTTSVSAPKSGEGTPSPDAVSTAKGVLKEPPAQIVPKENRTVVEPAAPAAVATPAPSTGNAPKVEPGAAPPAAGSPVASTPTATPEITKAALIKQVLAPGSNAFDGLPASKDPRILQPKIDKFNSDIDALNETIRNAQRNSEAMQSPGGAKQIELWQSNLTNLKAQRDDLQRIADAAIDSVISVPLARAVKDAETRADLQAKLDFLGPTKAAELAEELKRRAITDPLDVKKAVDTAVGTAQGTLDTDEKKVAFGKNIDRQSAAQEKAFQMATQGQQLVNQANAYMRAVTDKDGNVVVSGGPLGNKFATASQVLQQMGFSPKFAQELTGTDPNAAGASKKLQASFASEMARLDLEKSPAVREFSTYMNTSPGVDLPEKTLIWLMNNVIVPKAEAMKKGYLAVASLKPEKDNIERALFDYNENNPWFMTENAPNIAGGKGTQGAQGAQTPAPVRRDIPAGTPNNIIAEELRRREAQGRQ